MTNQQKPSKPTIMPRACHNCRLRKVRCNRAVPCSNCATSGLACPLGSKPATSQTRDASREVTPLSQNDNGSILERLSALEEAVQSLRQHASPEEQAQYAITKNTSFTFDSSEYHAPLPEGDMSFSKQALHASQVAELTSSKVSQLPSLMNELSSLRNQGASEPRRKEYISGPRRELSNVDVELPPSSFVLRVLRAIKESPGIRSLIHTFYGFYDCSQIEDACKRVYFPIETPQSGDITVLNGILALMLQELRYTRDSDLEANEIEKFQQLCERNFQIGIESYEITMIPTYENVLILTMGSTHAQSQAKLPLQWSLISTAARHALTLGYHHEDCLAQLPPLEAERVRHLFWHIYISDKNLSSRLGCTSTIQDFDVDTQLCGVPSDPGHKPWVTAIVSFVELGRIQAQMYESLYSSAARKRDPSERGAVAARLEEQLVRWYEDWCRLDTSAAYANEMFDVKFGPVNIIYYSVLTLLRRGITLSSSAHDISPACYEAAHQGLRAHLTYYPKLASLGPNALSTYAAWIFYYTSFTPFVVTFLHCIATSSSDDLQLLSDVLESFSQFSPTLEYVQKQLNLCKALHRIAEAFLRSQKPTATTTQELPMSTLCLPLQNPFPNNWTWLDSNVQLSGFTTDLDGWEIPNLGQTAFSLGDQM